MFYTSLYFLALFAFTALLTGILYFFTRSVLKSLLAFLAVFALGAVLYVTFLDNYLTRRWGGSMTVEIPAGTQMMGMTWKEDSLWIQYYDPAKDICVFREQSPVGVVEGEVKTPRCNPVGVSK